MNQTLQIEILREFVENFENNCDANDPLDVMDYRAAAREALNQVDDHDPIGEIRAKLAGAGIDSAAITEDVRAKIEAVKWLRFHADNYGDARASLILSLLASH